MASEIHVFKGKFLRIQTPKTIDGIRAKVDDLNRPEYKITFLPMSALKEIKRQNAKRPQSLQHKIDVIEGETPVSNRL